MSDDDFLAVSRAMRSERDAAESARRAQRSKELADASRKHKSILGTTRTIAAALKVQRVPPDIRIDRQIATTRQGFFRSRAEYSMAVVVEGWRFGDTFNTYTDSESRTILTTSTARGYFVSSDDPQIHRYDLSNRLDMQQGLLFATIDSSWSGPVNGPLSTASYGADYSGLLHGLASLAMKYDIDIEKLPPASDSAHDDK